MRIGEVIGTVTLNRPHPDLVGSRYKLVVPLTLDDLAEPVGAVARSDKASKAIVVYDELGAGVGNRIAISEGGEAAAPFYPDARAIDAYSAAILDQININK